jgi:hypothetical protein
MEPLRLCEITEDITQIAQKIILQSTQNFSKQNYTNDTQQPKYRNNFAAHLTKTF